MAAMTISRVSRDFGVSVRMLRYYEQAGLIESCRSGDYAYRMYDGEAVSRLQTILLLRKLRIPVKQIKTILNSPDAVAAVRIFRQNIGELDAEIAALSVIRDILLRFVDELEKKAGVHIRRLLTEDDTLLAAIESLSPIGINFKEDKTMDNLKKADETLSKLTDVRIVYLPPAAVAAAHYIGDDPEDHANRMIDDFVNKTGLLKIKPDVRHYGFNHPNPTDETGAHGYEMWVTIPEGMEAPPPLSKKQFTGGLYAAHMIAMGSFNEWDWLFEWVQKSEKYEFAGDFGDPAHMFGCLEEHLNYYNHAGLGSSEPEGMQLDLLIPVRERAN